MPPVRNDRHTLEGVYEGHQYKIHYRNILKPEFSREPDPTIPRPLDPRPPSLRLRDLECIRTLGSGQDGQVLLVRTTRNTHPLDVPGSLFALKVFKRKNIRVLDGHNPNKKNAERSLLAQMPWNSFVTGLVDAFHDWRNLYLMLEFIPRGSLRSLIQKHAPLDPVTSAFYFANIVTALAFLQQHEVIHRDIKPDNILVGADGYLSLVDFGTAAKEDERNGWLMVGTPAYMAPELFEQQESAYLAVDWWSAGCVLYEMTTRKFPFYSHAPSVTFKKAKRAKLHWPPTLRVGNNLKSVITGLLTVKASDRLGYGGAADVMQHPWLSSVDWDKIRERQYLAPPPAFDSLHTWHKQPLPGQSRLPGLRIAPVPAHLAFDNRFPEKMQI